MSIYPKILVNPQPSVINTIIHLNSLAAEIGQFCRTDNWVNGSVWPAANRAIYVPFFVETPMTAFQMAVWVVTQSGNLDIGLYDEGGNKLTTTGSTPVAAAGIQTFDITDTALAPGVYYMALCVDNITASFRRIGTGFGALWTQMVGIQQQAVGSVTLPSPATFANPATAYVPLIATFFNATI